MSFALQPEAAAVSAPSTFQKKILSSSEKWRGVYFKKRVVAALKQPIAAISTHPKRRKSTLMKNSRRNQATSEGILKSLQEKGVSSVMLAGSDLNGIARGKVYPICSLLENPGQMRLSGIVSMIDYSSFPYQPPAGDTKWWPSWQEGYADFAAVPDTETARVVPWRDKTALILCDFEFLDGRGACGHFPRTALKRVLQRAGERGFVVKSAQELEFTFLADSSDKLWEKGFRDPAPLWPRSQAYELSPLNRFEPLIQSLINNLVRFNLPVEAWSIEAGPGQFECNLAPLEGLAAADCAFLYKLAVKEVASKQNLTATFLPKLSSQGFGNGNHLNISLWKNRKNLFFDASKPGAERSELMKSFVAGVLSCLKEFTVLYAPTINAYRRFVSHFSPGMMVAWSHDNRSTAIRTLVPNEAAARIEFRTAGADVSPHLLLAGVLAAGLHGIEKGMRCPTPILSDAYSDPSVDRVPETLGEAISRFEQSAVANEFFGEDFVRFYARAKTAELEAFEASVPDDQRSEVSSWEIARYIEAC